VITRILPLLFLAACSHQAPTPAATSQASASVSTVLEPADAAASTSDSTLVLDAVIARLARHGITATGGSATHTLRSTDARLAAASEGATADHVVLIEAEPTFISQVAGRYRWSVHITLTMAPHTDLEAAQTWEWKIPVFLRFYHERETEALDGAVPVLERNLDRALAEYLGT